MRKLRKVPRVKKMTHLFFKKKRGSPATPCPIGNSVLQSVAQRRTEGRTVEGEEGETHREATEQERMRDSEWEQVCKSFER